MGALKQLMVDAVEEEQPADPVVPSDTVTGPRVYRCPCTGQLTMNCECGPEASSAKPPLISQIEALRDTIRRDILGTILRPLDAYLRGTFKVQFNSRLKKWEMFERRWYFFYRLSCRRKTLCDIAWYIAYDELCNTRKHVGLDKLKYM